MKLGLYSVFASGMMLGGLTPQAEEPPAAFKVIAFYTGKSDEAHISFVGEANRWFLRMARESNFSYNSTTNWADLNGQVLAQYQVVIFLDTRPRIRINAKLSGSTWAGEAPGWAFISLLSR